MAALGLRRWGRQQPPQVPQIDWSHPLAQGLKVFLWAPGAGKPLDLVSGKVATVTGPGQAMTEIGLAQRLNGTSSGFSLPVDLTATSKIFVGAWWHPESAAATPIAELTPNYNVNEGSFGIFYGDGGVGNWTGTNWLSANMHEQSPASKITADATPEPPLGRLHHIGAELNRAAVDTFIYIDGVIQPMTRPGTTNNTAMSTNYANSTLYVGARAGTSLFGAARVPLLTLHTRLLSRTEIVQLYTEPYGLLLPQVPRQRYWIAPATTVYFFHHSGSVLATTTSTGAGHSQRHKSGSTSTSTVASGAGHAGHHSSGTSIATTTTVGTDGVAHRRGTGSAFAATVTSGTGHGTGHGSALATTVTTGVGHSSRDGAGATVSGVTVTSGAGHSVRHGVGATVTDVTLVHGVGVAGRGGDGSALLGDIITGSGVAQRHGVGLVLLATLVSGSGRAAFSAGAFVTLRPGRLVSHSTTETGRLSPTPHRPSGVIVVGGSE